MPNWCDNQITITGPNSVIDKIEKIVNEEKDGDGLLNFMSPMPKELDGTTSPSSSADKPQPMIEGFDNWYDWRCENWSTKWEVNEFYGVEDGTELLENIAEQGLNYFTEAESDSGGVNSARGDVGAYNIRNMGVGNTLTLTIAGARAVLTSDENIFIALAVESFRPA